MKYILILIALLTGCVASYENSETLQKQANKEPYEKGFYKTRQALSVKNTIPTYYNDYRDSVRCKIKFNGELLPAEKNGLGSAFKLVWNVFEIDTAAIVEKFGGYEGVLILVYGR